jgi:hypothetical protein
MRLGSLGEFRPSDARRQLVRSPLFAEASTLQKPFPDGRRDSRSGSATIRSLVIPNCLPVHLTCPRYGGKIFLPIR